MFTWLFGSKLKRLQQQLIKQEREIKEYIINFEYYGVKIPEYCTVRGGFCESSGLMLWEKDITGKYTYMNMRHCNEFYNVPYQDVKGLLGKTNTELLSVLNKMEGEDNTFNKICTQSDNFVLKERKLLRFWEIGYINNKIAIFDVKKQPLYDKNGKIKGLRCWASSLSDRECEIKTLLEVYLKNGTAKRIDEPYDNGSASYLITKQESRFNKQFLK